MASSPVRWLRQLQGRREIKAGEKREGGGMAHAPTHARKGGSAAGFAGEVASEDGTRRGKVGEWERVHRPLPAAGAIGVEEPHDHARIIHRD